MNPNITDNIEKLRQAISQEAYEASSVGDIMAKVMGPKPSCPLTSVALLKSNKGKIKEGAELGMTKMEAAIVIACDPRNTGKLSPATLARDMEKVVGKWSVFKKNLALCNSTAGDFSAKAPSHISLIANRSNKVPTMLAASARRPNSNPFLDKTFDGEGEL